MSITRVLKFFIFILLHILILGLIPLGLFCLNISETPTIILAILWLAALWAARIILDKKRPAEHRKSFWAGNIGLIVLDTAILFLIILCTVYNPYWNSQTFVNYWGEPDSGNTTLTKQEALEDYEFAMKYLEKLHPLAIHGLPSEIITQADEVKKHIESMDSIRGYELSRELESILARLHDGHTSVSYRFAEPHIMKHRYEREKKKDTLVGINGISLIDILHQNPYLFSYEMESWAIENIKRQAFMLEGLKYLGINTTGTITYNYVTADGTQDNDFVTEKDFLLNEEYQKYKEAVTGDDLNKESSEDYDFVSYELDIPRSLAILKLDKCNYNKQYKRTLAEMFEKVHELGIQNVAVDLRKNGGGDATVAPEFISYLNVDSYKNYSIEARKDFKLFWSLFESVTHYFISGENTSDLNEKKGHAFAGNVYVLTSSNTFSAAMDFTVLIQDNKIGKVIGEAPGNMPSSYGDVSCFTLPNSGLSMHVPWRAFHRPDNTKEAIPAIPDIECEASNALDQLKTLIDERKSNSGND